MVLLQAAELFLDENVLEWDHVEAATCYAGAWLVPWPRMRGTPDAHDHAPGAAVTRTSSSRAAGTTAYEATFCVAMATAKVAVFRIGVRDETVNDSQRRRRGRREHGGQDLGATSSGRYVTEGGVSRVALISEVKLEALSQQEAMSYPFDVADEQARL